MTKYQKLQAYVWRYISKSFRFAKISVYKTNYLLFVYQIAYNI